jgi:hypothetical protein
MTMFKGNPDVRPELALSVPQGRRWSTTLFVAILLLYLFYLSVFVLLLLLLFCFVLFFVVIRSEVRSSAARKQNTSDVANPTQSPQQARRTERPTRTGATWGRHTQGRAGVATSPELARRRRRTQKHTPEKDTTPRKRTKLERRALDAGLSAPPHRRSGALCRVDPALMERRALASPARSVAAPVCACRCSPRRRALTRPHVGRASVDVEPADQKNCGRELSREKISTGNPTVK